MSEQNELSELRRLAEVVNDRSEEIGESTWYPKYEFFLPDGDSMHESEQEYLAALDPATILKLLDRIEALERRVADERKTDEQIRDAALEEAARIVEAYKVSAGNSAAGEMAADWTMDALREIRDVIRALIGKEGKS